MRNSLPLLAALSAFGFADGFAQENFSAQTSYTVLSSNPNEVIVSVKPDYTFRSVTDEKTGASYERISFSGGSLNGIAIGAPAAEWLSLALLAPSKEPARIQILSVEYEPVRNAALAPVPKWSFAKDEFKTPEEHYIQNTSLYQAPQENAASIGDVNIFRTAYTQTLRIDPIGFDAARNQIRLVKSMTVKISFAQNSSDPKYLSSLSPQEAEFFSGLFVNGNTYQFYHSAVSEVTKALAPSSAISYKNSASPQSDEKWLLITTTDQGVYHITSGQLSQAGVTNFDPASVRLFGYGGASIPEDVDSATGELHECAVDIITNGGGGSFAEARFYEPGINEWYYNPNSGKTPLFGLYHLLNPFTSSGHYLLKVGGTGSGKRIAMHPENPPSPLVQTTVATVAVHENEEHFENNQNVSREFVGEDIPKGRDASVALPDLPGYTSDSTVMRPGFNSHATLEHTFHLSLNGTALNDIIDDNVIYADGEQYTSRNWGTEILANNLLRSQNNSLVLSAASSEADTYFWLNWVEIFYRREAKLNAGQVPFYILADGRSLSYNFSEAPSGEAWDVSDPWNPVKIAASNGTSMNAAVQGNAAGFRQFVAFTASSVKTPAVSSTTSLALHDGICQTGAAEIIVTPKDFLDQANKLAKQRTMGGQATGPLSVAVVTVEDIYREFGYGSPDYSAIRNFLAYMFRHTTANNSTKPLYLTLFANGHMDYRNKVTQLPVGVPIYEIWKYSPATKMECNGLRSTEPDYTPEDPFFVRLTPNSERMDAAVGRVTVHNADEADAFVSKVIKYETSSDRGDWRARASFVSDDRYYEGLDKPDGIDHLVDTKSELDQVPPRIVINKIFGHVYPNTFTSQGRRKPQMEKDIIDAFNSGSAIISWVGHGNPAIWANEAILTVPATINKLTNFNRLAFVTTATCDFSRFDNYGAPVSGGVQLITKPDGGAIASLGTSRSVYPAEPLVPEFYRVLLNTGCNELVGSAPIGVAYIAGRNAGRAGNAEKFYIMGDPAQRVIIPRQYVVIDSINGTAFNGSDAPHTIPALSQLAISAHISNVCDGSDIDASFNGNASVTLFDAPTHVSVTTTFLDDHPITDQWNIDGPILYHGSSTVTGGKFKATFIVPKDIKFDTNNAKISMLAYSDNFRSALGVTTNIRIYGIDTGRASSDHNGPALSVYIGSRAFHSGDVVPVNSKIIVDVSDISGLNSSTASIGHSFIAWTDDSTAGAIDMASTYVSKQDDYTSGSSEQQAQLPIGTHLLKVRAFDALDNPTFGEVEFTARDVQPYALYNTTIIPNPVRKNAIITFLQPSSPESPVDVMVTIFSVIGQRVRDLSAQSISQNSVSIPFNGKDDSGMILADGVYTYRITARERLSGIQTFFGGKFVIVRN